MRERKRGIAGGNQHRRRRLRPSPAKSQYFIRRLLFAVDEQCVGPGLHLGLASLNSFRLAETGYQRLRAGDDQRSPARSFRSRQFSLKLADRDQLLPPVGAQTSVLGKSLVLNDDRRHPGVG